jgi:hypothetical protein
MGTRCNHLLMFYAKGGFRYRCVLCMGRFRIHTGVLMSPEKERDWWNSHGQRWPWDTEPSSQAQGEQRDGR